jgi:hypothetical protein
MPAVFPEPKRSVGIRDPVAAVEMSLLDPGSQSLRSIGQDTLVGIRASM